MMSRAAYIPDVGRAISLNISHTLASFRFAANADEMPDLAAIMGLKDTWDDQASASAFGGIPAPSGGDAQDFFGDEDFDMGGDGPAGFDDAESAGGYGGEEGEDPFGSGMGLGLAAPGDDHGPFDPRRQGQSELVMAMVGDGDEDGMFDYFDKGFGKAWAGAEHWKLRKVAKKGSCQSSENSIDLMSDINAAATTSRAARVVKAPFSIDFMSASTEATSSKRLFAPASSSAISLPSAAKKRRTSSKRTSINDAKRRKEECLLPDDMHFSSRQLLSLFLKPKFAVSHSQHPRVLTLNCAVQLRMRKNPNRSRLESECTL